MPTPTATPAPQPTRAVAPAPVQTPTPFLAAAVVCLQEVLSPEELVDLASGKVPLISTLIAAQQCQARLGELGATLPLSVEQLECLKLYGGDDALQALAGTTSPPEDIAKALESCGIELDALTGP